GIRVDTFIYDGYVMPSFYDSLIAKIIAKGHNRREAIRRVLRAVEEFKLNGIKTTLPLHEKILNNEYFIKGEYYTDFIIKRIFTAE
ncbi:MAG: acetyl-CoA carboxylase biotin carboxylase subunit, partial [Elusimicrobiota bacterium]